MRGTGSQHQGRAALHVGTALPAWPQAARRLPGRPFLNAVPWGCADARTLPAPGRHATDAAAGGSSAGTGFCSTYVTSASVAVPRRALPAPYRAWKWHMGLGWGNLVSQADPCDANMAHGRASEQCWGLQGCCSATPSASLSTEGRRCPQLPEPATFSSLNALGMSPAPLQGASSLDVALGEQPPSL